MDPKEVAKTEALRLLTRARKTAELKEIPEENEREEIFLLDGTRYEEINDDIADLKSELKSAGLALADIGTDEAELSRLRAASTRLNASYLKEITAKRDSDID